MKGEMSEEEFEAVKHEIAERLKDVVYATADVNAEVALNSIKRTVFDKPSSEEITITFVIHMCTGDVQQIVARMRRGKGTKDKCKQLKL